MTRPRSGRSTGTRRPRRRASSSSQGNQAAIIGGVAGVALVVVLVFVLSRGGSDAAAATSTPPAAGGAPPAADARGTRAEDPDLSGGTERAGKTPDRPAPSIAAADMQRAEEHYRAAVEKWNDSQRSRNAGDQTAYAQALDDAFEELQKQREALRTYTDWFEEADLGDWAMPAEYDVLQQKLDVYDRLYQRVKKLKQVR